MKRRVQLTNSGPQNTASAPDQHRDDIPRGQLLSRKEAMHLLAGAGAFMLVGRVAFGQEDTCVVRPELTEGPYYVEDELERSDIRFDTTDGSVRAGAVLNLAFEVTELIDGVCVPLEGAIVEIWHCDAAGEYSGVSDGGFNTIGRNFLRGYQITDENGTVGFTTIYPGWYSGRAVHIHFKVRSSASSSEAFEFTSQLFFDDVLTDDVHAESPYADKGYRDTLNSDDGIFQGGGDQLLLDITGNSTDGYLSVFNIALELNGSAETSVDCTAPDASKSARAQGDMGTLGILAGLLALLRFSGEKT
ncbi:MAG: intradiol ring-cleavage dioxygenase [Candidatus Hydrogenedentes bacterium]|nr:intradiol ring-cleavage dioxygenase [Candidatus Hydrogenedentota bacterium]